APVSPGTAAIPPATSPGGEGAPAPTGPPALARFVASGPGPGPAPWAPLGIGLAAAALALGGVVLLGRRLGW
ncbi:MAG TPA: hypothetical protein VFP23_05195, partial [Solirubrobacterales bacterium]|nr:hypothetical protein [Solirubrobacterales bacterium]